MKYLFAFVIGLSLPGCAQEEQFGWTPPPPPEERKEVYGSSAPDFPTMGEVIEKQDKQVKHE
jgi:hypothetical protein